MTVCTLGLLSQFSAAALCDPSGSSKTLGLNTSTRDKLKSGDVQSEKGIQSDFSKGGLGSDFAKTGRNNPKRFSLKSKSKFLDKPMSDKTVAQGKGQFLNNNQRFLSDGYGIRGSKSGVPEYGREKADFNKGSHKSLSNADTGVGSAFSLKNR